MKKLLFITISILLIVCFAGCTVADPTKNQGSSAAATEATEAPKVNKADFSDDFDGLCKYFIEKKYINDVKDNEMDYKLIGADNGKYYASSFNGSTVLIELYDFSNADNETAKRIINEVKQNGSFMLYTDEQLKSVEDVGTENQEISAVLSDNGKFLMIYTDQKANDGDDKSIEHKNEIIDEFKKF